MSSSSSGHQCCLYFVVGDVVKALLAFATSTAAAGSDGSTAEPPCGSEADAAEAAAALATGVGMDDWVAQVDLNGRTALHCAVVGGTLPKHPKYNLIWREGTDRLLVDTEATADVEEPARLSIVTQLLGPRDLPLDQRCFWSRLMSATASPHVLSCAQHFRLSDTDCCCNWPLCGVAQTLGCPSTALTKTARIIHRCLSILSLTRVHFVLTFDLLYCLWCRLHPSVLVVRPGPHHGKHTRTHKPLGHPYCNLQPASSSYHVPHLP